MQYCDLYTFHLNLKSYINFFFYSNHFCTSHTSYYNFNQIDWTRIIKKNRYRSFNCLIVYNTTEFKNSLHCASRPQLTLTKDQICLTLLVAWRLEIEIVKTLNFFLISILTGRFFSFTNSNKYKKIINIKIVLDYGGYRDPGHVHAEYS